MKIVELLEHCSDLLRASQEAFALGQDRDAAISMTNGRLLATHGTLHLYHFEVPADLALEEDVPLTVLPSGNLEPTEGFVLSRRGRDIWIQSFDAFGQQPNAVTLIPDVAGFYDLASRRLADMATSPEKFTLGPAERLVPWLDPELKEARRPSTLPTAVLTVLDQEDQQARRQQLVAMALEGVKTNKRVLLISPTHEASDTLVGLLARTLRGAGLQYKSLVSRYEMPLQREASGMVLADLGFEAQMHKFYSKSRNEKAALRRKYERFRELTPLLAYKAEKQRDLDEVKLLEWRLLTQLSDLQNKMKEIDQTLQDYEALSVWKRLSMQAIGKNVQSLGEYRTIYQSQVDTALNELDIAKARIEELRPEAAIPRDIRPEYQELTEEVSRLGGTKKIRELLAAAEGTNRQAFLQNKRLVVTTAARVLTDPLFARVPFDLLLVDEAARIPAAYLVGAAGLVRERIVVGGIPQEVGHPLVEGPRSHAVS